MKFKQYDVVRLKALLKPPDMANDAFNLRRPVAGDTATIIEIYTEPLAYELECSNDDGITQWLIAFREEDIDLELAR